MSLSDLLNPHQNFSSFLWRWRWWLVGISGVVMFLLMNTGTIITPSGNITDDDLHIRLQMAFLFAIFFMLLVAWYISILHSLFKRNINKKKWFAALLFIPPIAFIYLFISGR